MTILPKSSSSVHIHSGAASRPGTAGQRVRARKVLVETHEGSQVSPGERHALISVRAYLLAEQRGFVAGHELEDWLAAEAEVDRRLAGQRRSN